MTLLENHREVWDSLHAEGYRGYTKDAEGRFNIIRSMAPDKVNLESMVLEIGCGSGEIMKQFTPYVREIWGVDISEEAIGVAWESLMDYPNTHPQVNDGITLKEFADESLDLVYSFWTFQHIPRSFTYSYVKESKRVLRDDGKLVFQVVSYDDDSMNHGDIGLLDKESKQIGYTEKDVRRLVKGCGLKVSYLRVERWLPDRVFLWVLCEK